MRDHKSKVDSDDFHQYVFGKDLDLLNDSDIAWFDEARSKARQRVELKNNSTYVDVAGKKVILPKEAITRKDAEQMIERAFESLSAHWHAESLVNPIVREARKRAGLLDPLDEAWLLPRTFSLFSIEELERGERFSLAGSLWPHLGSRMRAQCLAMEWPPARAPS